MFVTTRVRSRLALAGAIAALALSGCGGSGTEDARDTSASETEIEVVNIAYAPETLEIGVGEAVVWTNKDEQVRHTVTSGTPGDNGVPGVSEGQPSKPDGIFAGDLPDASATFTFTFDETGTFPYFCEVHPSMVGEIVVR